MVYNIANAIRLIGAGISHQYFTATVGNPLFPLITISIIFLLILGVIFYWSDSPNKWKRFSAFGLVTILAVSVILFSNKYFQSTKSGSFLGGNSVKLPDASYFMTQPTPTHTEVFPESSFADLFD
jgi:ABC-type Mn2+/Zn2+ transport system permease subunit